VIDTTKVLSKLRVIKENLVKLNKLKEVPEEIFIKDFEKHDSAKYSLQTSIEAMIDICNHIISRKCLGMPKTKADAFIILCQNSLIHYFLTLQCSSSVHTLFTIIRSEINTSTFSASLFIHCILSKTEIWAIEPVELGL